MQAYPQGRFTNLHLFVLELLPPLLRIQHATPYKVSKANCFGLQLSYNVNNKLTV
jgi:hypothetical protein